MLRSCEKLMEADGVAAAWLLDEEAVPSLFSQFEVVDSTIEPRWTSNGRELWTGSPPKSSLSGSSSIRTALTEARDSSSGGGSPLMTLPTEALEEFNVPYSVHEDIRTVIRKGSASEATIVQAIEALGGGNKGLQVMTDLNMSWIQGCSRYGKDATFFESLKQLCHLSDQCVPSSPAPVYHQSLGEPLITTSMDDKMQTMNSENGYYQSMATHPPTTSSSDLWSSVGSTMTTSAYPCLSSLGSEEGNVDPDAAIRRAARKNRIQQRRKHVMPHQYRSRLHSAGGGTSSSSSQGSISKSALASPKSSPGLHLPSTQGHGREMEALHSLFHKVLHPSDLTKLGRVVIPRKEAETHLPYLAMREGVFITMEDFSTGGKWTFRYRFWLNNKSRMYLLENTGEFVKAHRLKEGDALVIYQNLEGTFVIRGESSARLEACKVEDDSHAGTAKKKDEKIRLKRKCR